MNPTEILLCHSQAAMAAGVHSLRIMANRGLASPSDIDESLEGVLHFLEQMPDEIQASMQQTIVPLFADLKRVATANWKGE